MPTISRPFIDKLLLSFIDAHLPANEKVLLRQRNRERRLKLAKRALFGEGERDKHFEDRHALSFMAEAYLRDRWIDVKNGERIRKEKPRSVRLLAKEASQFAFGNSSVSIIQRLRSEFRDNKKQKYLDIARYQDGVDDSIDYQVLENVQTLLQAYKINMNLSEAAGTAPGVRQKKRAKLATKRQP